MSADRVRCYSCRNAGVATADGLCPRCGTRIKAPPERRASSWVDGLGYVALVVEVVFSLVTLVYVAASCG